MLKRNTRKKNQRICFGLCLFLSSVLLVACASEIKEEITLLQDKEEVSATEHAEPEIQEHKEEYSEESIEEANRLSEKVDVTGTPPDRGDMPELYKKFLNGEIGAKDKQAERVFWADGWEKLAEDLYWEEMSNYVAYYSLCDLDGDKEPELLYNMVSGGSNPFCFLSIKEEQLVVLDYFWANTRFSCDIFDSGTVSKWYHHFGENRKIGHYNSEGEYIESIELNMESVGEIIGEEYEYYYFLNADYETRYDIATAEEYQQIMEQYCVGEKIDWQANLYCMDGQLKWPEKEKNSTLNNDVIGTPPDRGDMPELYKKFLNGEIGAKEKDSEEIIWADGWDKVYADIGSIWERYCTYYSLLDLDGDRVEELIYTIDNCDDGYLICFIHMSNDELIVWDYFETHTSKIGCDIYDSGIICIGYSDYCYDRKFGRYNSQGEFIELLDTHISAEDTEAWLNDECEYYYYLNEDYAIRFDVGTEDELNRIIEEYCNGKEVSRKSNFWWEDNVLEWEED